MFATFRDCFAELGGFALVDPARLTPGVDYLTLFTTTDEAHGVAVPALDIEPDWYKVTIRPGQADGERLNPETGELVLCGLGYLVEWDPAEPKHRRLTVPPGRYDVEVRQSPGLVEFVLGTHVH